MRRLKELDEIRPKLEVWIDGMAKGMGQSAVCLGIFTEDYKKGIAGMKSFSV